MKYLYRFIIPVLIIIAFIVIHIQVDLDLKATDYLSFCMILLTYFYVVFTWEILNRMGEQSYLEKRPYLIADFVEERRILKVYVENIGKTPAKKVKIEIDPDIKNHNGKSLNEGVFKNNIEFFPPQKKVETVIHSFIEFFKDKKYEFNIKLNYEDSFGKKYQEFIKVDLTHIEEQEYIKTKNFNDLVKSIDKLTETLKKGQ